MNRWPFGFYLFMEAFKGAVFSLKLGVIPEGYRGKSGAGKKY